MSFQAFCLYVNWNKTLELWRNKFNFHHSITRENTWTGREDVDNTWKYSCLDLATLFRARWASITEWNLYSLYEVKVSQNNQETDFWIDDVLVTTGAPYADAG